MQDINKTPPQTTNPNPQTFLMLWGLTQPSAVFPDMIPYPRLQMLWGGLLTNPGLLPDGLRHQTPDADSRLQMRLQCCGGAC